MRVDILSVIVGVIICATAMYLMAFTGKSGDGQALILQAPDGHCAKAQIDNANVLTMVTVECP